MHYICESKEKVIEGEVRCAALAKYIEKTNAPYRVWLAEDGSSVISKVEYDPATNQVVGLLLPTHATNGLPIPFSFIAKSADDIQKYVLEKPTSLIYFVMAQPLKQNTPPFLLLMLGTDNRFTFKTVIQRWTSLKQRLAK